jgi:ribonuclease R
MDPRTIVAFLRTEAGRPLKPRELAKALGVPPEELPAFRKQLQRLEADGVLYRVQRQRYAAPERINLQVGRIQTTRGGAGFLVPEEGGPDVFVPTEALTTAVDGDRVVVRVESRQRSERPQGRVIRVLERARAAVVGVFHEPRPGRHGRRVSHGFVVPEDRKLPWDVFVAPGGASGAVDGDVVVVRVTDWGSEHRGPAGEVTEVLGRWGQPGVDVAAVMRGHGLGEAFPQEVEAAAESLRAAGITEADLEGRQDLRGLHIFTIDPADARDHDDALSIEETGGGWRIGVHIADVTHYVRERDPLDREAARRGTSAYLVDRVIPMLPHALSSELCSLLPGVDRLTLSLFIDLGGDGSVREHSLVRGVIRSACKVSYEEAQAVLDGTTSLDAATDDALRRLHEVAGLLRRQREGRGSLDFDLPETRVVLGATGEPTDIQRVTRLDAHRLVEDFMLLANEVIARRAGRAEVPFVYRVHEAPDAARMTQLREFVATLGHRLTGRTGEPGARDLQRLLRAAAGRPEEGLVSTVVLRSMKQARYSEQNLGHFGLAARAYTHFTSPIRRYPDLIVHRLCAALFIDGAAPWLGDEELGAMARHASERERVAVAAERDSKDLKRVQFMQRHLGDEFEGTVSSVTAFGFFVLLDAFFVEGLVHVSSLGDDYYLFVEEQYALIGERTRRRFRTGDRLRVRVAAVSLEERRITFEVVDPIEGRTGPRSAPRGGRGAGPGGSRGKARAGRT